MTEIYRFRAMEYLLGDFQELEKQSIYFASQEELNDPVEGLQNIFFKGDEIVWSNFFKQYIYCLVRTIINFTLLGDQINRDELESAIPVAERRDQFSQNVPQYPFAIVSSLSNEIYNRAYKHIELEKFIFEIGKIKRRIRSEELIIYLKTMHLKLFFEVHKVLVDLGLELFDEQEFKGFDAHIEFSVNDLIQLIQSNVDAENLEKMFVASSQMLSNLNLVAKYIQQEEPQKTCEGNQLRANVKLIVFDFPNSYVKQLAVQLIYPKWYTACFTRNWQNSSVWGHYAENHRGVCLIFEANESREGGMPTIYLNGITDFKNNQEVWSNFQMHFYNIKYQKKVSEIDFFQSIGQVSKEILEKFWYRDEDGNLSKCGDHLEANNQDLWKKNYWENFYHDITTKTRDWEYEQENRLILSNPFYDWDEKCRRTLTYDFSSLKGVIFGIKTSDDDKFKIIQTIQKNAISTIGLNLSFIKLTTALILVGSENMNSAFLRRF